MKYEIHRVYHNGNSGAFCSWPYINLPLFDSYQAATEYIEQNTARFEGERLQIVIYIPSTKPKKKSFWDHLFGQSPYERT